MQLRKTMFLRWQSIALIAVVLILGPIFHVRRIPQSISIWVKETITLLLLFGGGLVTTSAILAWKCHDDISKIDTRSANLLDVDRVRINNIIRKIRRFLRYESCALLAVAALTALANTELVKSAANEHPSIGFTIAGGVYFGLVLAIAHYISLATVTDEWRDSISEYGISETTAKNEALRQCATSGARRINADGSKWYDAGSSRARSPKKKRQRFSNSKRSRTR